jgi:hypothetical protein
VFGEYTATCIDIRLHPIDCVRMCDEYISIGFGWVNGVWIAATVEQEHVVLIEVRLAVPQIASGVEIGRAGFIVEANASSRVGRLLVHADAAATVWVGEFGVVDAHAT